MKTQILIREFIFTKSGNIKTLPDPNPQWTPLKVKEHYTQAHPELLNSNVSEPKISDGKITYEFTTNPGTKG